MAYFFVALRKILLNVRICTSRRILLVRLELYSFVDVL